MISVAMTTYNGEKYIIDQLNSILSQTVQVDEIIICDDMSTDRTIEKIKSFSDKRIKLKINDINLGYVKNFSQAISLTNGDYIFLADQDDIWVPQKVEKMITVMKKTKCSLLCTNFNLMNEKGNVIQNKDKYNIPSFVKKNHKTILSEISFNRLLLGNVVQGCTYCFTKNIKRKYLAVNNSEVFHDWQLMLIASCIGKVFFYNDDLINYRLHKKNSIGFSEKNEKIKFETKKPKKKPTMITFFDDVSRVIHLSWKNRLKINLIFYLRIAYLIAELHIPI